MTMVCTGGYPQPPKPRAPPTRPRSEVLRAHSSFGIDCLSDEAGVERLAGSPDGEGDAKELASDNAMSLDGGHALEQQRVANGPEQRVVAGTDGGEVDQAALLRVAALGQASPALELAGVSRSGVHAKGGDDGVTVGVGHAAEASGHGGADQGAEAVDGAQALALELQFVLAGESGIDLRIDDDEQPLERVLQGADLRGALGHVGQAHFQAGALLVDLVAPPDE